MWLNLESAIQNEISEKEKNIIYSSIYIDFRKKVLVNLFAGQEWRYRCTEWTCRKSTGEMAREREGRMN